MGPADGESFTGEGTVVLLRWNPVGELLPDAWYSVVVEYTNRDGEPDMIGDWVKEAQWQLPRELYRRIHLENRELRWSVTVMLQTGVLPDGRRDGVAVSPSSEVRSLFWH